MSLYGEALTFFADWQRDETKRTALNIQYTEKPKGNVLTLNVEMATIGVNNIPEWDSKISLQLSKYELTDLCSLLFGLKKKVEAKYHGQHKNKGFTLYNNGATGVIIQLSEAGRVLQHLLGHHQRIELGVFVLRRQAQAWGVSPSDVLAVLRQSVSIARSSNDND